MYAYNSAGVMIDAIRGAKLALHRGISGPLESISAYCFKHPPIEIPYAQAKANFIEFVEGKRELVIFIIKLLVNNILLNCHMRS